MLPNNAALRLHILIDGVADIPLAEEIKCRRARSSPNAQPPRVTLRSPKRTARTPDPPKEPLIGKRRCGREKSKRRLRNINCGILIAITRWLSFPRGFP